MEKKISDRHCNLKKTKKSKHPDTSVEPVTKPLCRIRRGLNSCPLSAARGTAVCGSPNNGADVEDPTFILPIQQPRQLHGHKGRHHYPNPKTVNRPGDVWGRGGEEGHGAERREGGWSVWDGRSGRGHGVGVCLCTAVSVCCRDSPGGCSSSGPNPSKNLEQWWPIFSPPKTEPGKSSGCFGLLSFVQMALWQATKKVYMYIYIKLGNVHFNSPDKTADWRFAVKFEFDQHWSIKKKKREEKK